MNVLLTIGAIFVGSFFYFFVGFFFFHLSSIIEDKWKIGGWAYDCYDCGGVFICMIWPIIFFIWVIEMFFSLPWKLAHKILSKRLYYI